MFPKRLKTGLKMANRVATVVIGKKVYRRKAEEPTKEEEQELRQEGNEFQFNDAHLGILGRALIMGLAIIFKNSGMTKDEMKKLNMNKVLQALPALVRKVAMEKGPIREELRFLVRYGPEQYIVRKARELRNM